MQFFNIALEVLFNQMQSGKKACMRIKRKKKIINSYNLSFTKKNPYTIRRQTVRTIKTVWQDQYTKINSISLQQQ